MIPLNMEVLDVFFQRASQGVLAEQNNLDRHSSFTDLTQRSE
jgi:hypothetical protein